MYANTATSAVPQVQLSTPPAQVQLATPPPQSVLLQPQSTMPAGQSKSREKYKSTLFALGITEIILGSLSCILCIATLVIARTVITYREFIGRRAYYWSIDYFMNDVFQGIWCGVAIIASGVLGIKAKTHHSACMYIANMVLSIIASCFMATLCILSGICAGIVEPKEHAIGYVVVHCFIALIGFTGMVICIVHSAYCCAGVCCRKDRYQGVVMYTAQPGQQQMVQLANGQYMAIPANASQTYPVMSVPGPSYQPATQMPQVIGGASSNPPMPTQQMTKEQEAEMNPNPPEYTAFPSENQSV